MEKFVRHPQIQINVLLFIKLLMEQVFVQSLNSLVKINFLQTFFILVLIKDHFYLVMKMVPCFLYSFDSRSHVCFLTKFWLRLGLVWPTMAPTWPVPSGPECRDQGLRSRDFRVRSDGDWSSWIF